MGCGTRTCSYGTSDSKELNFLATKSAVKLLRSGRDEFRWQSRLAARVFVIRVDIATRRVRWPAVLDRLSVCCGCHPQIRMPE